MTNSTPILLQSKDESRFDVLIRPESVKMIFLPLEIIASRRYISPMFPSNDVDLEIGSDDWNEKTVLKTTLMTDASVELNLISQNIDQFLSDIIKLAKHCDLLLMESQHLQHEGRRVLLNLNAVSEIKTRPRHRKNRIYFNYSGDRNQSFLQNHDAEDYEQDRNLLFSSTPDVLHVKHIQELLHQNLLNKATINPESIQV